MNKIVDSMRAQFWVVIGVVFVAGFSQGMLMPVIAILFEQDGVSSSLNGLNTSAVYLGILISAPFMERILQKLGFKNGLFLGGLTVAIALGLFPIWHSFWFWFLLRFIIGFGDSMLQIGAQTWITTFSPAHRRGLNVALFGLFFGLGFAVGPMMTNFLSVSEALPFVVSALLSLLATLSLLLLQQSYPERSSTDTTEKKHVLSVFKYAWVALLFPLGYGFLEASLNGNFPVYALQSGIGVREVSIILPAFAIGSVVLQLPLGSLSDHIGRKRILMISLAIGVIGFTVAGLLQASIIALIICFFITGMFVGSLYSLGLSYMVDLIPRYLLTAGNTLCSVLYAIGSLSGPIIGGTALQYVPGVNFFYIISVFLVIILIALLFFKTKEKTV